MIDIKKYSNGRFFDRDSKEEKWKLEHFLSTESVRDWIFDVIDKKIADVLEIMNLPTRNQISELSDNIKLINQKLEAIRELAAAPPRYNAPSDIPTTADNNNIPQNNYENSNQDNKAAAIKEEITADSESLLNNKNPFEEFAEKAGLSNENIIKKRASKKTVDTSYKNKKRTRRKT